MAKKKLLEGDKFISEMHLKQPNLPIVHADHLKNNERIQNI